MCEYVCCSLPRRCNDRSELQLSGSQKGSCNMCCLPYTLASFFIHVVRKCCAIVHTHTHTPFGIPPLPSVPYRNIQSNRCFLCFIVKNFLFFLFFLFYPERWLFCCCFSLSSPVSLCCWLLSFHLDFYFYFLFFLFYFCNSQLLHSLHSWKKVTQLNDHLCSCRRG